MNKVFQINQNDNVCVALLDLKKGDSIKVNNQVIKVLNDIPTAHKVAIKPILKGENIIKYGYPIGHATKDIQVGEHVHTQNVQTNLAEEFTYTYSPELKELEKSKSINVLAYKRPTGEVGIRNNLLIVPLVGCINRQADLIKDELLKQIDHTLIDDVIVLKHPYGCSQLGDDFTNTKETLKGIVKHPNAGGVLVLSLGCENNQMSEFIEYLGDYNKDRIVFLKAQDVSDEISTGVNLCLSLYKKMIKDKRVLVPLKEITIGLKCGGSDGFSGITANPLVGMFSDYIVSLGGSTILTEVPEMFGAEQILMNRCINEDIYHKTVSLINNFKQYYTDHHQVCYENPSPGNKMGGITTLEDKSLGCTQKAGSSNVVDCLKLGEHPVHKGLNLLNGPGNDMVACTNLACSSCHLILFTTGRGTPFGTFVPTMKIATNTTLAIKKQNWIDFNAGRIVDGDDPDNVFEDFKKTIIDIINGKKTKNELNGFEEIAIFKDGVTL